MATPIHEIMAESSAGMARERDRRARRRRPARILPSRFMGAGNQGIMNPNLIPAVDNTAGRRGWKPHPFLSRSTGRAPLTPKTIFSTPEENEFSGGILPGYKQSYDNYMNARIKQPTERLLADTIKSSKDVYSTPEENESNRLSKQEYLNLLRIVDPSNARFNPILSGRVSAYEQSYDDYMKNKLFNRGGIASLPYAR